MSIEKNIESIAASLAIIAETMQFKVASTPVQPVARVAPDQVQTVAPTFTTPEPVNQVPAMGASQPSVPAFAPPAFAATPEPAPAAIALPFSDTAGFTQYLIASFQKLEAKAPGTGGNIQRVIESIGCKNVNEVQPGSWVTVYSEVEKLVA